MSTSDASPSPSAGNHSERLYMTWWGWLPPLTAGVLLAAAVHRGYPAVPTWLPYTVAVAIAVALVLRMGATAVRIVGEGDARELRVGGARLPVARVGAVTVVRRRDKQAAMGPRLDPSAYVVHRAWVPTLVRVEVDDPADPTPYWQFSTRHPHRIAQLLRPETHEAPAERDRSPRKG